MSAFVVIPEEEWETMQKTLTGLTEAVARVEALLAESEGVSKNPVTTVSGKGNIAKVLGCSQDMVSTLCAKHVLGTLMWKADNKKSAVMHLDKIEKAKERYHKWLTLPLNVKDAMLDLPDAGYIEEYWQAKFGL